MLTIVHSKAGPLGRSQDAAGQMAAALRRGWAVAAPILLWPVRVLRARQLAHTFATMDDRELADLGLTRQDVCDATGLPIQDDPSLFLAERRWQGRRGQGGCPAGIPAAWR
jgi:uncharacterized protein YjiS (DUF1127 family)